MRFYDVTSWSYVNLDDPNNKRSRKVPGESCIRWVELWAWLCRMTYEGIHVRTSLTLNIHKTLRAGFT